MRPWDGGWHMGWMAFLWLGTPLLLAGLGWLLFKGRDARPTTQSQSPERILKRRYARGEIDRDTYERMLRDLGDA